MPDSFFGHPRGLATLFLTEMWERFTYYGMRAILILFLTSAVASGGFGFDDKTAAAIYGLYTAGAYLAALPGGWIADRLIGAQKAVIAGAIAIATGNVLLSLSSEPRGFYAGLIVIVLGVGLLKPNVSAMVAELYPDGGARLDAGFTLFYMGINVGGFLGPLITGFAFEHWGARYGFAAAALFMTFGLAQFLWTRAQLQGAGLLAAPVHALGSDAPVTRGKEWRRLAVGVVVGLGLVMSVAAGFIPIDPPALAQAAAWIIVAIAALYFLYYFLIADLSREERRRGVVLVVLFLGCALFFSGYEQAGSSLNLFAERYTDRSLGILNFVIPTGWFQSLNSLFIFIFAPFFAWVWVALARRHLNPSAPAKFAYGVILMGLGFVVMAAASLAALHGKVASSWLIVTYLLHTFGELCLSPVGLSYYTKLAPKRFVGQLMGMWFLAMSLGNLVAGLIAGEFDDRNLAAMPGQYMRIVYFSVGLGALLLISSRPVKKLMGNVV